MAGNFWADLHEGLGAIYDRYEDPNELGAAVASLRLTYRGMGNSGVSPDFDSNLVRDAYALAYHPGHAYSYLEIFTKHPVGTAILRNLKANSKIGVIGAGCGAETLGLLHFLREHYFLVKDMTIGFFDRADWSQQRERSFFYPLRLLCGQSQPKIDSVTGDLVASQDANIVRSFVTGCDLLFCSALFTEIPHGAKRDDGFSKIIEALEVGSQLCIIDETHVAGFSHWLRELASDSRLRNLGTGSVEVRVPQPPPWLKSCVLNFQGHQFPRFDYKLSWILFEKI